ncbi:uncharacterized protein VTP21DRAFT_3665 [Calcarisporiella thermophila]|uniref:uncharacterized protein n=1 Tax=Calcarisporiella thermophila TaxID=911321 RepID=UPI003743F544
MRMQLSFAAIFALIAAAAAHPKGGVSNSCNANQHVYCCNQQNTNKGGNGLLGIPIGVFTGCSLIDNIPVGILGAALAVNQKCQNKQATVCCDEKVQNGIINVDLVSCSALNVL